MIHLEYNSDRSCPMGLFRICEKSRREVSEQPKGRGLSAFHGDMKQQATVRRLATSQSHLASFLIRYRLQDGQKTGLLLTVDSAYRASRRLPHRCTVAPAPRAAKDFRDDIHLVIRVVEQACFESKRLIIEKDKNK